MANNNITETTETAETTIALEVPETTTPASIPAKTRKPRTKKADTPKRTKLRSIEELDKVTIKDMSLGERAKMCEVYAQRCEKLINILKENKEYAQELQKQIEETVLEKTKAEKKLAVLKVQIEAVNSVAQAMK